MQLRFLNYFTVLCEELHFGRAANRLAITQPPLSAAIKNLEEDLGVQLLVRSSKHVQLTPAGAAFQAEALQILDRVAQARSIVTAVDHGRQGRLDIGITGSLLYSDVPTILKAFRARAPGIDVVLHEMPSVDQLQSLMGGQLHAVFVNGTSAPSKLTAMAVRKDEFVLCVPEDHALAKRRSVKLSQLGEERFVMLSRVSAPARHDDVISSFSQAGIHPQIAHRSRSWLGVIALVARDGGLALVPRQMASTGMAGVRFVAVAGTPIEAPAMLVWNPKMLAPALALFIECARTCVERNDALTRKLRKTKASA